jgi:hypothetical protein
MEETIEWLYLNNSTDTIRYVLGEKSKKMVACIGINPSSAKPNELDNTLKSVKRIAEFNGFDGWIMFNVYPQRATDPANLDNEIDHNLRLTNIGVIRRFIKRLGIDTIWIAYGDLIESREYLPYCMSSLYTSLSHLNLNWKIIGNPTQKGHPRHPLYKATESTFEDFDMEKYVLNKLKPKTKKFDGIYIDGIEFK